MGSAEERGELCFEQGLRCALDSGGVGDGEQWQGLRNI